MSWQKACCFLEIKYQKETLHNDITWQAHHCRTIIIHLSLQNGQATAFSHHKLTYKRHRRTSFKKFKYRLLFYLVQTYHNKVNIRNMNVNKTSNEFQKYSIPSTKLTLHYLSWYRTACAFNFLYLFLFGYRRTSLLEIFWLVNLDYYSHLRVIALFFLLLYF